MIFGLIMAGGLGKRMGSTLPKVLHEINGKPMICHVIDKAFAAGCSKIGIIVGIYHDIIMKKISEFYDNDLRITYILQPEPQGTGHAVKCALNYMETHLFPDTSILILSGDVPLISVETLKSLTTNNNCILITKTLKSDGFGRIIFNSNNSVEKIIEHKDCNLDQRKIQYINCGIYNIDLKVLSEIINKITNINVAKEYYLTDLIELSNAFGYKIRSYELPENKIIEVANINTLEDLAYVKSQI